jgi:hypothetical protein
MVMNNIGAASMCERELAKQEDIEQSRDEWAAFAMQGKLTEDRSRFENENRGCDWESTFVNKDRKNAFQDCRQSAIRFPCYWCR